MQKVVDIIDEEVVIFEDSQYADIGDEAHREERLPLANAIAFFHQDTGAIIDDDDSEEDEDIGGDEGGVEKAGDEEQEEPAPFMGGEVIQTGDDREEKQEGEGVEAHKRLFTFSAEDDLQGMEHDLPVQCK